MTSIITVEAVCKDDLEVSVIALDKHPITGETNGISLGILQNGEKNQYYITSTRSIIISEDLKIKPDKSGNVVEKIKSKLGNV